MTTDDIIRMAQKAGFTGQERKTFMAEIVLLATLVVAAELNARQKAQAENEELKGVIARHGLEIQHAVLAEREACADIVCLYTRQTNNMEARGCLASVSFDIRTRQTA